MLPERQVYLRIADLVDDSIVDGPGLRLTVFTQGCPHHCPGCHNPGTHAPNGGHIVIIDDILHRYEQNPLLSGITFSGGEPFMQPGPLALLARRVHELHGDVVTYTGYVFEHLAAQCDNEEIASLLLETDILIDGPFIQELRSLELLFRGSANQRILDREMRAEILAGLAQKST